MLTPEDKLGVFQEKSYFKKLFLNVFLFILFMKK